MNSHTAIIKSFGTTGVLLVLALVLLAIVSAIVAFDRWPESGSSSTVERIAVDRPEARRVETQLVAERRETPLVRGVVVVRSSAIATASGAGDVFLVADGGRGGQSDGGGFGPPPPPVPFNAPGEGGGGVPRFGGNGATSGQRPGGTQPPSGENPVDRVACEARNALGAAGAPLEPACKSGSRSLVREVMADTGAGTGAVTGVVTGVVDDAVQVELSAGR